MIHQNSPPRLRMIDLFSGTGAFTQSFNTMADVVFANDMSSPSKKIYDANFEHVLTLGDINDLSVEQIPAHDILTGGFPCQPFSIAGQQEGFDDVRANVFWKMMEIVDAHFPRCIFLENVKNLLSHDKGSTFRIITNALEKRGYHVRHKILNTADITGIPQHRERIYIIAFQSKEHADALYLDFAHIPKRNLSDFLEKDVPEKYYYTSKSKTWNTIHSGVVEKNKIYQYRRTYVRENKSDECPTLTANMGSGGHNVPLLLDEKGIRKLTPRECFNLQGFPATYHCPASMSDASLYKLAGNAVSIPVIKRIAERIIDILTTTPSPTPSRKK